MSRSGVYKFGVSRFVGFAVQGFKYGVMGCGVSGSGFRVWDSGFQVRGFGVSRFVVSCSGFGAFVVWGFRGSWFRVRGFTVRGSGFLVQGFALGIQGYRFGVVGFLGSGLWGFSVQGLGFQGRGFAFGVRGFRYLGFLMFEVSQFRGSGCIGSGF